MSAKATAAGRYGARPGFCAAGATKPGTRDSWSAGNTGAEDEASGSGSNSSVSKAWVGGGAFCRGDGTGRLGGAIFSRRKDVSGIFLNTLDGRERLLVQNFFEELKRLVPGM